MVDRSDLMILYVEHPSGGAYQTFRYVQNQGENLSIWLLKNSQSPRGRRNHGEKTKHIYSSYCSDFIDCSCILVGKIKPTDTASSDIDKMVQRVENALGDDFKKQSKTEVAATLVYGNGEEDANINYHILKTTYYEADPNEITGLNIDALNVLFNPESANSCEQMKIQDWDAALYKTKSRGYLCWTDSPEVSYVLEYNPQTIADEEIIKMAESAEPYEK